MQYLTTRKGENMLMTELQGQTPYEALENAKNRITANAATKMLYSDNPKETKLGQTLIADTLTNQPKIAAMRNAASNAQ